MLFRSEQLQYISALYYFDQEVLAKLENTKIIHLWAYADFDFNNFDPFKLNNIEYLHRWKTGVEIRPSMITVSMANVESKKLFADTRLNHLDGVEKNTIIFNWIKTAIDNYKQGTCLSFDEDVLNLRRN